MTITITRLLVITEVFLLPACGRKHKPPYVPKAIDVVADCTPFTDHRGHKMLSFNVDSKSVSMDEVISSPDDESGSDVFTSKHLRRTWGTFDVDETSMLVTVTLEGRSEQYVAFEPATIDQCILIYGSLNGANLSASWFGTPIDESSE